MGVAFEAAGEDHSSHALGLRCQDKPHQKLDNTNVAAMRPTGQLHQAEQAHSEELGVQELALRGQKSSRQDVCAAFMRTQLGNLPCNMHMGKQISQRVAHTRHWQPRVSSTALAKKERLPSKAKLPFSPALPAQPSPIPRPGLTSAAAAATRASACCCGLPAASGVMELWLRAHSSMAAASAGGSSSSS